MDRVSIPLLTWDEVTKIIQKGELEKLGRSNEQHHEYVEFMDQIKNNYASVVDYLLISKFQFDSECVNGKVAAIRSPAQQGRLLLATNDFPYNFEDGIQHFVLWKLGGAVLESEISDAISEIISKASPDPVECVSYVNPLALKSIPEIDHAHILVRTFLPRQEDEKK